VAEERGAGVLADDADIDVGRWLVDEAEALALQRDFVIGGVAEADILARFDSDARFAD